MYAFKPDADHTSKQSLRYFFFELWPEQMINAVFETADAIEKPYNKISVAIFFP